MKRYFAAMVILLGAVIDASAAVVYVTVNGSASWSGPTPPELGNRQFIANYSYDDSVAVTPTTTTYENALLSFSMTFTGGSTFTATGGNIRANNSEFSIYSMNNENFPSLAGMQYTDFVLFKLYHTGPAPADRLPTAEELSTGYQPWFSWFGYDNNVNALILGHSAFTAVPEPSVALLGLSSLGLLFRRRRDP